MPAKSPRYPGLNPALGGPQRENFQNIIFNIYFEVRVLIDSGLFVYKTKLYTVYIYIYIMEFWKTE